MNRDIYADRSVDDLGELLIAMDDHLPADQDPRHQLHDIAERVLGNEYTRNLPPAMPETT